jgi:hypothetical protein
VFTAAPGSSLSSRSHLVSVWASSPRVAPGPAPPRHGRPPAAARQQWCDAQLPPSRLHSLSSLAAAYTGMGKTPKRVGGNRQRPRGIPIGSRSRQCRGKEDRGALLLEAMAWRPTWIHTSGGRGAFSVTEQGQRGQFPLAESLGPGRARASLDVWANSRPAIPSRAQGAGRRDGVGSR